MYLANRGIDLPFTTEGTAYYLLAERIGDSFPEGAKTIKQMYEKVGRPLRLPKGDFKVLVDRAVREGYIARS